jgi:hypothetical protein
MVSAGRDVIGRKQSQKPHPETRRDAAPPLVAGGLPTRLMEFVV